jgi:3-oxo-4-pregnene-20-carboxyl-CoA dehydrogenase alpha subunit
MAGADEASAFAETVAAIAQGALSSPPAWRAGEWGDDASDRLSAELSAAGWLTLREDPDLLELAGPAGYELGRRLAPLRDLDDLLGGSPLAGELVRYAGDGRAAARIEPNGLVLTEIGSSTPCPYLDTIAVSRVIDTGAERRLGGEATRMQLDAWIASTVGYCAGVAEVALTETVAYARQRRAFGTTLSGLAPVQQLLADAATTARGLRLLAGERPGLAALAHAGPAVCGVTGTCQQVAGAVGFTLEFPLQRAWRRARTLHSWSAAALDALADVPG